MYAELPGDERSQNKTALGSSTGGKDKYSNFVFPGFVWEDESEQSVLR